MFGLFNKQPDLIQFPTNPDDKILPLNAADDTDVLRSVVVVLSYRFDDVLDPVKLKDTYEKLLDRPGWRKIGARLRMNVSNPGDLELLFKFEEHAVDSFSSPMDASSITFRRTLTRNDQL